MPTPPSRLAPYKAALKDLSQRTRTPLPSLVVSFGILHELTAIVPLVGLFYASRTAGVGESVVNAIEGGENNWMTNKCREWIEEGEKWAERLGKRYGFFGFQKGMTAEVKGRIVGDVANAVVAYGATKALLPLRIGVSFYLSPAFSRGVVEPVRRAVMRPFRRGS